MRKTEQEQEQETGAIKHDKVREGKQKGTEWHGTERNGTEREATNMKELGKKREKASRPHTVHRHFVDLSFQKSTSDVASMRFPPVEAF